MQNRFKFRVFISDKKNSKNSLTGMFKVHSLHTGTNKAIITSLYGNCSIKLENNILMQCTGLKDKNGTLIYEWDIVQFYDDGILKTMKIVWDNDELDFKAIGLKKSVECYGQDFSYLGCIEKEDNLEVIGNIYENPELLKEES